MYGLIMLVIYARSLSKSPCITIGFGIKMREKCKSSSPSAVQLKNGHKTSNIEEKLYVISQLEKCDRTLNIRHVRYAHISVRTIRDNANRITGSAKSGTKVFE
jgi:hypothetical protein